MFKPVCTAMVMALLTLALPVMATAMDQPHNDDNRTTDIGKNKTVDLVIDENSDEENREIDQRLVDDVIPTRVVLRRRGGIVDDEQPKAVRHRDLIDARTHSIINDPNRINQHVTSIRASTFRFNLNPPYDN